MQNKLSHIQNPLNLTPGQPHLGKHFFQPNCSMQFLKLEWDRCQICFYPQADKNHQMVTVQLQGT